jgi:SNF2 family DNA or RNA helicase
MRVKVDLSEGIIVIYPDGDISWAGSLRPKSVTGTEIVLDYSAETLSELWKLGLDIRGLTPFDFQYRPDLPKEYRPMPHQLATAGFLTVHRRAYLTSDTRTGKTLACAMALDYLRRTEPGAALIVCPLSVMETAWASSLHMADADARTGLLRGTKKQRLKILDSKANYYIINYDGLTMLEDRLLSMVLRREITKVIVDELNHFGNPGAARYKAADAVFNDAAVPVKYLWGLTGTPGADTMAVFGMCRLVNFSGMPWKTKTAWQAGIQYKYGPEAWQWRDRPETSSIIHRVMQPNIRYAREAVLDNLPPVIHMSRETQLTEQQLKYYSEMKRDMVIRFERGEVVSADQKAALLSKLFQICLGMVITDCGAVSLNNKYRIELLKDLINETSRKTVIYCHFTAAIQDLADKLKASFSVARVDGTVTGPKRDEIFKAFRAARDPRVLIAHQKTVAYGTELAAADQLINNGPQLSGVSTYSQGLDRASSREQLSDHIAVVDVWGSPEERVYMQALNTRKRHSDIISDLFTSIGRREL